MKKYEEYINESNENDSDCFVYIDKQLNYGFFKDLEILKSNYPKAKEYKNGHSNNEIYYRFNKNTFLYFDLRL